MAYGVQRQSRTKAAQVATTRNRVLQRNGSSAGGVAPPLLPGQLDPSFFPSIPVGRHDHSNPHLTRTTSTLSLNWYSHPQAPPHGPLPPLSSLSRSQSSAGLSLCGSRLSLAPSLVGWQGLELLCVGPGSRSPLPPYRPRTGGAPPSSQHSSFQNSHHNQVLQRSGSSAAPLFPPTPAGRHDQSIPRVPRRTSSLYKQSHPHAPPHGQAGPLPPLSSLSRSQSSAGSPSSLSGSSMGGSSVRSSPAPSPIGWQGLEPLRGGLGGRSPPPYRLRTGGAPPPLRHRGKVFQNSHHNQDFDPHEEIRIVLIGKTGNGKSASGNTILNEKVFKSVLSPLSVTSKCEKVRGVVDGRKIAVIDTPGIFDTKYKEDEVVRKLKECISLSAPGPHVFVIVIKLDKFTQEEKKAVELLQMVFGDKAADYSLVLFTHGDQLGHTRIEDFFRQSQELSHLIEKCNRRYHVFNNNVLNNSQVPQLIAKIERMVSANGGTFYTNKLFQKAEGTIQGRAKAKQVRKYSFQNAHHNQDFDPNEEIRIVLIGKTGNGKSASGNTILNEKVFKSVLSPLSVTSKCEKARGVVNGRRIAVIDTPGIFDTKYKEDEVVRKLKKCISLSAPGPHVFVIVIKLDKFTREEKKAVELLQMVFGDKAADYSLVLFTHGDQLGHTRIEDFFRQSQELSHLIEKCNRRYHVFNNKVPNNSQVPQLLAKIERMVSANGGTFYTNELFQEAEKAIQEQARENMKARAEQIRREEEKLRAKFKGELLQEKLENLQEEHKRQSRQKAEKKNRFIETGLAVAGAEVGLAIGLAAATAGGPICMGIGAAVGGVAGAVVGVLAPTAVKAIKKKCSVQ